MVGVHHVERVVINYLQLIGHEYIIDPEHIEKSIVSACRTTATAHEGIVHTQAYLPVGIRYRRIVKVPAKYKRIWGRF